MRNSRPVSASYLADYLGRHQRGISLEHMAETLATGTDPLHLSLVFTIDHTNAMAYANAARNLLTGTLGRDCHPIARHEHEGALGKRNARAVIVGDDPDDPGVAHLYGSCSS